MANVLGSLFSDIAKAIREKVEVVGTMKPSEFANKIRSISSGADSEDIDLFLDQINGEVIGESQYTVTFHYNGTSFQVDVYDGYNCPDPVESGLIDTPTQASTKYVNYTFSGWSFTEGGTADSNALTRIEANRTLYAAFTESLIYISKGSCGTSATYTINPDYVLTVSGTGDMKHYNSATEVPWNSYRDQIPKVVIEPGIKSIGGYSFYGCTKLTEVVLPEGFTTIQYFAFQQCQMLATIVFPSTMQYIYNNAFTNTQVRHITLPYGMRWFETNAFDYTDLESVTLLRTDGWRFGYSSYSETQYTELTPEEAANSDKVIECMNLSGARYWWNEKWKEDAT
jgi:hypothetical protein